MYKSSRQLSTDVHPPSFFHSPHPSPVSNRSTQSYSGMQGKGAT